MLNSCSYASGDCIVTGSMTCSSCLVHPPLCYVISAYPYSMLAFKLYVCMAKFCTSSSSALLVCLEDQAPISQADPLAYTVFTKDSTEYEQSPSLSVRIRTGYLVHKGSEGYCTMEPDTRMSRR